MSADGRWAAAKTTIDEGHYRYKKEVHVWDTVTGKKLFSKSLSWHRFDFTPNGKRLVGVKGHGATASVQSVDLEGRVKGSIRHAFDNFDKLKVRGERNVWIIHKTAATRLDLRSKTKVASIPLTSAAADMGFRAKLLAARRSRERVDLIEVATGKTRCQMKAGLGSSSFFASDTRILYMTENAANRVVVRDFNTKD